MTTAGYVERVTGLPGGPDLAHSVPLDPVEGFTVEMYGELSAKIAQARGSRGALLAAAGLDEARYLRVEQTWLLRLASAAIRQEQEILLAFASAQDRVLNPTNG